MKDPVDRCVSVQLFKVRASLVKAEAACFAALETVMDNDCEDEDFITQPVLETIQDILAVRKKFEEAL